MLKLLACALLLAGSLGCIIEDDDGHHWHHHRIAAAEAGHVHAAGCGHVLIEGVWCEP